MKTLDLTTFPLEGQQLIEASAGTGKTYTITNLYLRLLLGHGRERPLAVDEILVLTFTVAATEELRVRIRRRITECRDAFINGHSEDKFLTSLVDAFQDDDRSGKLLTAAVQLMDEAAIHTIHGFCARVLSEESFASGTLFDQDLDADKDQLLEMAARDCFRKHLLTLSPVEREVALGIWPTPESLVQSTRSLIFRRNLKILPDVEPGDIDPQAFEQTLSRAKDLWISGDLENLLANTGLHKGRNQYKKLAQMTAMCEDPTALDPTDELWQFWRRDKIAGALNKSGTMPDHECLNLIEEVAAIPNTLTASLWHRVMDSIKSLLQEYKTRANQLTVDDLLTQLADAVASNQSLAKHLANVYPVALVDEFQDTDDIQWQIFKTIYSEQSTCLLLIGDPKQAIYQFRGADVFTYVNARRDTGDNIHTLGTNWRSAPALIDAVNTLFNQPSIFDNDRDIPFFPVEPAPGAENRVLKVRDTSPPAFDVFIASKPDAETLNKNEARQLCAEYAAEHACQLLNMSTDDQAHINNKAINAGQIAFLVRSGLDARAVREALARRQINSVYVMPESVFLQSTAEDLKLVLEAILEPGNLRAIKTALATPLLMTPVSEIHALDEDAPLQQQVMQEFQDYHELWDSRDIAPMIEALMERRQIASRWLGLPEGERQITNLRHLAELLQHRTTTAPGMHRLLKWFGREKQAAETDAVAERQLRLESDENLIKIVTMHAAKGLEYDIVYIPFGGFAFDRYTPPYLFHEEVGDDFQTCVGVVKDEVHKDKTRSETLAEDMRLLYVAMTRARHQCILGVPNYTTLKHSALARLLKINECEPDGYESTLQSLKGSFAVQTITESNLTRLISTDLASQLTAPPSPPVIRGHWRIHSYTGISNLLKSKKGDQAPIVVGGFGDDDENEAPQETSETPSRFNFPRGARPGIELHSLFENIDFQADEAAIAKEVQRTTARLGLANGQWQDVALNWVADVLSSPIDDSGFRLKDIAAADTIDEMEFHFPLTDQRELIQTIQAFGYLPRTESIALPVNGIMTGLIDLLVRSQDKYYLVDYKSNHLGNHLTDYTPPSLQQAVTHHQYDLQYLIYTVALHRFLRARLPAYQYHTHFGGVRYLFLRGMDGNTQNGVFSDNPAFELIDKLDHMLSAQ